MVGPTDSGHFHKLTVGSIQRNRSACRVLRAGQAATLALGNFDRSLLRKVRPATFALSLVFYLFFFYRDNLLANLFVCAPQGMVMVSPEMNPTICWVFEAEIVLLFHAKTFHKGFQVTVHTGNVRQTATVVAVRDKVGSFTQTWDACIISQCVGFLLYSQCLFCFCFSLF